ARRRHHQGGGHALIGHIPDHEAQPAIVKVEEVVEVSTDLSGGQVARGQSPAWKRGQVPGQERLLDYARNAHFLLDALTYTHLRLLLAYQLRDAHGRCRLDCKVVEEPTVISRVVLFAQVRAQVQKAHQFTLAD